MTVKQMQEEYNAVSDLCCRLKEEYIQLQNIFDTIIDDEGVSLNEYETVCEDYIKIKDKLFQKMEEKSNLYRQLEGKIYNSSASMV